MQMRTAGLSIALSTVVLAIAVGAAAPRAQAPGAASRLQGKPNLSGIWQAITEANWDIRPHQARPGPPQFGALFAEPAGLGVVDGGEVPYQPWAAAKQKENFAKRWELDPEAKCFMPGVPRATYMPFPFQIIQGTNKIVIAYAFASASRLIHMDKVDDSPAENWMGCRAAGGTGIRWWSM